MKNILIIEDSVVLQKMYEKLIIKYGCLPTIVASAEHGLEVIKHNTFDMIITDCNLPGINGPEFIKRIKLSKYFKEQLIIFSTPNPSEFDEVINLVNGYLIKPFKPNNIKMLLDFYLK